MSDQAWPLMSAEDQAEEGTALPGTACQERVQVRRANLWSEADAPDDLRAQRWGVFAPEGPRGDALLERVAPLVALRAEQQGAEVRIWRLPRVWSEREALDWRQRVFRPGDRFEDELPRYQLLLGDLHELPLVAQRMLGSDGFTGRLAFDDDEGYSAYVAKVLRWEAHRERPPAGPVLLFGAQDGTQATALGHETLLVPGLGLLGRAREQGRFAGSVQAAGLEEPEGPEALLALGQARPGATLLTLSHGEGPPRAGWASPERQRRRQGTLRFGSLGTLEPEAVAQSPFLPGGAWMCFACYGAGTPDASLFSRWLAELNAAPSGPGPRWLGSSLAPAGTGGFVGALPKAALANPEGPLVFVGHMDLAWSHSLSSGDVLGRGRPARFVALLRALAQGQRAGVAMLELSRFLEQANSELTTLLGGDSPPPPGDVALSHLWILRQDLAGYTLLGDPAARLPVGAGLSHATGAPLPGPAGGGLSQTTAPLSPAPAGVLPSTASTDPQEWEEALAELVRGGQSPEALAAGLNVSVTALREAHRRWREAGLRALGLSEPG